MGGQTPFSKIAETDGAQRGREGNSTVAESCLLLSDPRRCSVSGPRLRGGEGVGVPRGVRPRRPPQLGASPVISGICSSSKEMDPGRNISCSPLPGATIGRQMSGTTRKSQSTCPERRGRRGRGVGGGR